MRNSAGPLDGDVGSRHGRAARPHRRRAVTREYRAWLRRWISVRKALALVVVLAVGAGIALRRGRAHAAPATPHPVCVTGPTIPGIDVSYFQQTIDWHRVYRAGIRFAFIR